MSSGQEIVQLVPTLFFYFFAVCSVVGAILVVTQRDLLRSAVFLIVVLASGAGFIVLLGYYFMAGIQILVFVGGIVILLIYAIMMTRLEEESKEPLPLKKKLLAFGASGLFFITVCYALLHPDTHFIDNFAEVDTLDHVKEIGTKFLDMGPTGYLLPFELISVLLLSVIIGGIVIARKNISKY